MSDFERGDQVKVILDGGIRTGFIVWVREGPQQGPGDFKYAVFIDASEELSNLNRCTIWVDGEKLQAIAQN
jgi:hypothetical protein